MFKVIEVKNLIDLSLRKTEKKEYTLLVELKDFYPNLVKQLKEHKLDHKDWITFLNRWCITNMKGNVELLLDPSITPPKTKPERIYGPLRFEKDVDFTAFKSRWV